MNACGNLGTFAASLPDRRDVGVHPCKGRQIFTIFGFSIENHEAIWDINEARMANIRHTLGSDGVANTAQHSISYTQFPFSDAFSERR